MTSFPWTESFGGIPVTAQTRSTLEKLATTLSNLGCRVERHNPFDFNAAWENYGEIAAFELAMSAPLSLRVNSPAADL